jgi:DNA-binding transcriptional LysR family regulator
MDLLTKAEQSLNRYAAPKKLRLGLTSSLGPGMFASFITALEKRLHPLTVETSFDNSPRLVAHVKKKTLDAAIIAYPTSLQGLNFVELARIPQVVAVASQNPLAKRRTLSLGDIADQPVYWFARSRQPAFFDHCHRVFRRHGFAPNYLQEPNDHHVLLAEVGAGNGVAILPRSFTALRLNGVSYRPLREGEEIAVGVGLLGDAAQHPALGVVHEVAGLWVVAPAT